MKKRIDIQNLFSALDEEMRLKLSNKIDEIHHPTAKGDEMELNWMGLLRTYLPERYRVDKGFIVDHEGNISEQIDLIIYDRHFTPLIFKGENVVYIPAEGVYAVFEVKPDFNNKNYKYAIQKLKSVIELKRTSSSFPHIMGIDLKEPFEIIGGILTKENRSQKTFNNIKPGSELMIMVCLDSGVKVVGKEAIELRDKGPILVYFILKLIKELRNLGSVPALDVDKYLG